MQLDLVAARKRHAVGLISPCDTSLISLTGPGALVRDVVN